MATVFTHALVGAALARPASPDALPRGRLALAAAALAVLPDLDVLTFALGIPYEHPLGHRGLSHSIAFAIACGLAGAALVAGPPGRRLPARAWGGVAAVLVLAVASHGLLDALTDGGRGVGFLVPFSNRRFFLPWRPLAVSPIGAAAFLDGGAGRILRSELVWVWGPALALAAGATRLCRRPAHDGGRPRP